MNRTAGLLFLFVFFCQGIAKAEFNIEPHVSMPLGTSKMTQKGSTPAEHTSALDFGLVGGVRAGWSAGLDFGFVGEAAWKGFSFDRQLVSGGSAGYRVEINRLLAGVFAGVNLGASPFHLYAEYLPVMTSTVIYSDDKSENPFRKNDRQKGTGYGVGLGFRIGGLTIQGTWRVFNWNDVDHGGAPSAAAADTYGVLTGDEMLGSVGYRF